MFRTYPHNIRKNQIGFCCREAQSVYESRITLSGFFYGGHKLCYNLIPQL
jgi:hypothetical protein